MKEENFFNKSLPGIILVLFVGIIIYSNTFSVPFVLDDVTSIVDNPVIRSVQNFYANSSGYEYNPNRFIGYLTFALNYRFGGLDVTGYHIFNLAVHLGAALLVYVLVTLTFRTPYLAASKIAPRARLVGLLAALLFVAHPVQTQAVTYIVQRLCSLTTFFYLLSLAFYVQARLCLDSRASCHESSASGRTGSGKRLLLPLALLAGSVCSAVLAMKTKEIAFTLPFAALLYEVFFFQGTWKKRLLYLLPLLLTIPIIPLTIMTTGVPAGKLLADIGTRTRVDVHLSRLDYLFTQFRVIVTYLRLLVLPINQNLDYDYPTYSTFFTPPVFLSFLLLAGLVILALYLYGFRIKFFKSRFLPLSITYQPSQTADPAVRLISFGILWFFLTLSVESSLIPITDVIFEHRIYLAFFGVAAAFGTLFVLLSVRYGAVANGKIPLFIAGLIIVALCVATYQRNRIWGDTITLWRDISVKSPHKSRPYVNLGTAYGKAGRMKEAIAALSQAINIKPDDAEPYVNLGAALASIGRRDEAIRALSRAVKLEPDNADALNNLGIVLKGAGRVGEAIDVLSKAIRIQPDNARANYNLGLALMQAGRNAEAIKVLQQAVRIKPDYDNAVVELAAALNRTGRFQEAMTVLQPRLSMLAGRPDARFNFGMAAYCLGDNLTAQHELSALYRIHSGYAEQLKNVMQGTCEQGGK